MRLKKVKNAKERVEASEYFVRNPKDNIGRWQEVFKNENPIHIEIGMGKGKFIINMAKTYPNINFIGIEKYDSVMVKALNILDEEEKIPNLKLVLTDANDIEEVFKNDVDRIYLNFSDPWPKSKHEKRRLTSKNFLEKYDNVFKGKKEIFQKTDNFDFFEYSRKSFLEYGYEIKNLTYDLHNEDIFNIPTEYEEKFSAKGVKINRLEAYKD